MTTYEQKFAAALCELQRAGVREKKYMPPVFKWLKRRGWKVRPPLYNTFLMNFLMIATLGAAVWGTVMGGFFFITTTNEVPIPFKIALLISHATQLGFFMGLIMAGQLSYLRHKHKLSKWKDL